MKRRVLVVGVGTGVGKTHAACALLHAARSARVPAIGLKPVESGCSAGTIGDAERLAAASSVHPTAAPYRFAHGLSPHLAARLSDTTVLLQRVVAYVRDQASVDLQVIETAGGLLTPLSDSATNLDLVHALCPDMVLLVAVDRLGVLHDTHASLLALRTRVATAPTVILQAPETPDASTGTNAGELRRLHGTDVLAIPRGDPDDAAVLSALSPLVDLGVATRTAAPGARFES